jgi:hypothetical protein
MSQKNYKLKISKNKVILNEAGPSQYGTAGMQAASQLIKTSGEALKMTGAFLKRSWGATFGYAISIFKNIRKHGVIRGLAAANVAFVQSDKQIKNEMRSLINAQPGVKDANLFIGMTCPAARAFDVFVDKDFKLKNPLAIDPTKGSENRSREKYKSFYNFVMAVSHITSKTSLDLFKKNNKKLTRTERVKGIKKKYKVDKKALDNFKTKEFKETCKLIKVFYRPSTKLKKTFKEQSLDYFLLNDSQNNFIKFVIENPSEKECLKYIQENEIENSIENLASTILQNDSLECINYIKNNSQPENEDEEKEDLKAGFNTLIINKNKILIKEEEETKTKDVDLKASMALSFAAFYIMRASILSLLSEITVSVPLAINKATDIVFNSMLSSDNKVKIESSDEDSNIGSNIEKVNKQITLFNNQFEFKIEKIDDGILKELQDFAKKITSEIEKSEAELSSKISNEKELKIARSTGLIDILENIKSSAKDLKLSSDIVGSLNDSRSIIENDLIELKNISSIISDNEEKLSKIGIGMNVLEDVESRLDKIKEKTSLLNEMENKILNYTGKIDELKSSVDQETKEIEEENKEAEKSELQTVEVPKEKLETKKEK